MLNIVNIKSYHNLKSDNTSVTPLRGIDIPLTSVVAEAAKRLPVTWFVNHLRDDNIACANSDKDLPAAKQKGVLQYVDIKGGINTYSCVSNSFYFISLHKRSVYVSHELHTSWH